MKNTMRRFFAMVLPVVLAAVMAACSGGSDEAALVPKEATFVMHVDVASLWQKGDLANADNLQTVRDLRQQMKEVSPALDNIVEALLKDPASCGLDFSRQVCIFSDMDLEGNHGRVAVIAAVRSRSDFDKFLKDLEATADLYMDVEEENGQTLVELDGAQMLFNDKNAYLAVDISGRNDLEDYLERLATLDPKESMAKDANFGKYLAERKDISFYMGYRSLIGNNRLVSKSIVDTYGKKMADQLADCSISLVGSFEKGRIVMDARYYNMPSFLKAMQKSFDKKLLDYMPAEVLAAATMAVDLEEIIKMVGDEAGVDLDDRIDVKDYTVRDLVRAFGGSIAIDFYGWKQGMPLVAVALDIKNAELLRDLLDESGIPSDGNGVYNLDGIMPAWLYAGDKVAVMSTDAAVTSRAARGEKSNGMMAVASQAKKGNYFYLNLDQNAWPQELLQSIGLANNPVADIVLGMMDRFEAIGDKSDRGTATLYLTNEKENSLAYILHTVDQMN